jgi:hypothetical protein
MADPYFVLQADGEEPINAKVATGGICGSDGAGRSVILALSEPLKSGRPYRLRARNYSDRYAWSVPEALLVELPDSSQ